MLRGERLHHREKGMTLAECLLTLLLVSTVSTGVALFFSRMTADLKEISTQEGVPCETPICAEIPPYLQCSCGSTSWTVYV